jgi:hypothetical protein
MLTLVLAGLTVTVLVLSAPASLEDDLHRHQLYVFSMSFFRDIPKRLSGPGRFRFILQPLMAILLGIRHGVAEAHEGRPGYLSALLFNLAPRREVIRSFFKTTLNLLLMGVLVDSVCQWLVLGTSHLGASLVVGPVLVLTPYALARALANAYARLGNGRSTDSS